jgi:hypothetical protein
MLTCCQYYCSFIYVTALVWWAIIILLELSGNDFLDYLSHVDKYNEETKENRYRAIYA